MKNRWYLCALVLAGVAGGRLFAADEPPLADPKPQVETRGPLHEAFAQPYAKDVAPNVAIKQKPPEPVPEEPPDQRPEGKNVQWIPGYWQWDDERKDFLWISGFWRDVPEGRRWVVGYWADTDDGWRWVSGHWAAAQEPDRQVVPEPPPNLDEGPSTSAPDDNSFYIPGSWFYTETGYRWRSGYWADVRPDYVWVPSCYTWSPYGYYFRSGYWDYAPFRRGLLFAPVYWGPRPYFGRGFIFRPALALAARIVFDALWYRPGWGHYYYGNYYGGMYAGLGFRPWFGSGFGPGYFYDPIFSYQRWAYRNNPLWLANLRTTYDGRVAGRIAAPPRTLAEQVKVATAGSVGGVPRVTSVAKAPAIVTPLAEAAKAGVKLEKVAAPQRQAFTQSAQQMVSRSVEQSRAATQLKASGAARIGAPTRPTLTAPTRPTDFGATGRASSSVAPRIGATGPGATSLPRTDIGSRIGTNPSIAPRSGPVGGSITSPSTIRPPSLSPNVARPTAPIAQPRFTPSISRPSIQPPSRPQIQMPSRPSIGGGASMPRPNPGGAAGGSRPKR